MSSEGGVFSHSHAFLVGANLSIDRCVTSSVIVGGGIGEIVVLTIKIIPVELSSQVFDACSHCQAFWGLSSRAHVVEVADTAFIVKVSEELLGDDLEVGKGGRVRRPHIVGPVCRAVADHSAFKVNLFHSGVPISLEVVLVDLPCEVGHVDSSIGFAGNEEVVVAVLRVLGEPVTEGGDSILRLDHVVGV